VAQKDSFCAIRRAQELRFLNNHAQKLRALQEVRAGHADGSSALQMS